MPDANPFPLENHLQVPVELTVAGHPSLTGHFAGIPSAWQTVLSADAPAYDGVHLLWEPLYERARGWVTRLATITGGFALVTSPSENFSPRLFYIVAGLSGERHGWLAGMPATEASVAAAEKRLEQTLPASYWRFVQIHDGLLENGDGEVGFSPLASLEPLPEHPHLLSFFGDGFGKRQCYDLTSPVGHGDFLTVTWDDKIGVVRRPQSFWSLLKELTVYGFG